MLNIAHRGFSGKYSENSLSAFREAIKINGVDGVELDVRKSKDGTLVVIHDSNMERTMSAKGEISAMKVKELKTYKDKDGEQIPTLEEVLNLIGDKALINIEIKEKNSSNILLDTIRQFEQNGKRLNTLISSFLWDEIEQIRQLDNNIKVALALEENDFEECIRFARSVRAYSIHPEYYLLNQTLVQHIQSHNIKVITWTVNHSNKFIELKEMGVDGIITDYPDRLVRV